MKAKVLTAPGSSPVMPISPQLEPEPARFSLQVDRQTKASFSTYEAAEQRGIKLKKAHPVVRVSVYDTVECTNQIIDVPQGQSQVRTGTK